MKLIELENNKEYLKKEIKEKVEYIAFLQGKLKEVNIKILEEKTGLKLGYIIKTHFGDVVQITDVWVEKWKGTKITKQGKLYKNNGRIILHHDNLGEVLACSLEEYKRIIR